MCLKIGPDQRRHWLSRTDAYDGFIILHGTDTMAYVPPPPSYLIQNSENPLCSQAPQQPQQTSFTDAKSCNPTTCSLRARRQKRRSVVFGNEVIAGTRACKQRTLSFNAFTSVNYPLLAQYPWQQDYS